MIGKFCAIARGVKFIMNEANHNHNLDGFSTYPLALFGNGWETTQALLDQAPHKGNR